MGMFKRAVGGWVVEYGRWMRLLDALEAVRGIEESTDLAYFLETIRIL